MVLSGTLSSGDPDDGTKAQRPTSIPATRKPTAETSMRTSFHFAASLSLRARKIGIARITKSETMERTALTVTVVQSSE